MFWASDCTFHSDVDARRQKKSPEAVVEDLVSLQGGGGVVGDLDTCRGGWQV